MIIFLLTASVAQCTPVTLPTGLAVPLATAEPLSSKRQAKGDMVSLRVATDVTVGGKLAIAKGTEATGQISDSRGTGGLGVSGRLLVRPLYLRIGDRTVRLAGMKQATTKVPGATLVGLAVIGVPISGKNVSIAVGTPIDAEIEKRVDICAAPPAASS